MTKGYPPYNGKSIEYRFHWLRHKDGFFVVAMWKPEERIAERTFAPYWSIPGYQVAPEDLEKKGYEYWHPAEPPLDVLARSLKKEAT